MKRRHITKSLAMLILPALLLMALTVSPAMAADGAFTPGDCEYAVARCLSDALFISFQSDYVTNCLIGYAFCKKYVE
ncbi:MAG: hypothetical protein WBB73_17580 [Candidatus Aminicenantaceae bacterium]